MRYAFALASKFDHRNRALFIALALSVLLHLVLVFGWGGVRPVPPDAAGAGGTFVVVAAPSKSPASRGGGTVPLAPPRSAAAKSPALSMPKPVTEKLPLAQEKPLRLRRSLREMSRRAWRRRSWRQRRMPALAPSASPERKVPAGVPMAGESALRDGVPPDAMRQYRIDLKNVAARRFRHYPAAVRAGWEVAEVVVLVRATLRRPGRAYCARPVTICLMRQRSKCWYGLPRRRCCPTACADAALRCRCRSASAWRSEFRTGAGGAEVGRVQAECARPPVLQPGTQCELTLMKCHLLPGMLASSKRRVSSDSSPAAWLPSVRRAV